MKKFLFLLAFTTIGFISKSQLTYQWAGSAGSTLAEYGQEIATDPSGNVYVTGSFSGTVDFDPGPGTTTLSGLSGSTDIFMAKYNSAGVFIWVKQIGSTSTEKAYDIVADATGPYLAGTFMGNCNFNIGGVTNTITSLGGGSDGDGFFAKYDVNGNLTWVDRIGSTGNDRVTSIAIDATSNVFVTGFIGANADMDPGAPVVTLSVAGTYNTYFAKYTSAGAYTFAKQIVGAYSEGDDIALDATGNIYITGSYGSTNDFDPAPAFTVNLSTSGLGQLDIFLAKYTPAGLYTYAKQIGGIGTDIGFQVAPDALGNVYLGGVFSATCDFNPAPGFTNNIVSAGQGDLFVGKYDASGNYLWANGTGAAVNDYCYGLGLDASNNVYITGNINGAGIDFDPGPGVTAISSTTSSFYLASYNSAGAFNFVNSLGNINSDGKGLEVNSSVYVTGFFTGTADFDFGIPTATINSAGGSDVFYAKYNNCVGSPPAQPSSISGTTNMCVGSLQSYSVVNDPMAVSYTWSFPPGWTGTSTTNIVSPTAGTTGIISVVANGTCGASVSRTLAVTVNPLPTPTISSNSPVCQGQTLTLFASGGTTYTWSGPGGFTSNNQNPIIVNVQPINSGTYTSVMTNSNGCSATATLNVIINPAPVVTGTNLQVCLNQTIFLTSGGGGTYGWVGPGGFISSLQNPTIAPAQFTNSGSYFVTVTSTAACTSSAVTNVTVNPLPIANIISNSPVCAGAVLSFTGSGGVTYNWSGPNSFTSAVQNPTIGNVTMASGGVYTLIAGAGTCSNTTFAPVIILPSPTVNVVPSNTVVCAGKSVTMTASGANTYSWSQGGTNTVEVVSPTVSINYSVTGTGTNGCSNVAATSISVNPLPIISVNSSTNLLCSGQSATLTSGGASSYTWNVGGNNSTVVISPTVTTNYTVAGTDANGCTGNSIFTQSVTICMGLSSVASAQVGDEVILLFPNPCSNEIAITNLKQTSKLIVINSLGEIVFEKSISESNAKVNLSELSKGIYFVRISSGQTFKLVKE